MDTSSRWKNLVRTFLGAGLLALLLSQISLRSIWEQLLRLPLPWLLAGAAVFAGIYFFRTLRYRLLLSSDLGFVSLFRVVSVQSLANVVLPARLGELSYLYFLKRQQISLGKSLSSLMLARVFDLAALSAVFFAFLPFFGAPQGGAGFLIGAILVFFLLFLVCLILLVSLRERIWGILEALLGKFPFLRSRADNLKEAFYAFVEAFSTLRHFRHLAGVFMTSLGVWLSAHLFGYLCMVKMLYLPLTLPETVFILSFLQLVNLLPVHPFGGVGTVDVAWAFAVMSFGVSSEVAISSAVTAHIMTYGFSLLLGLAALRPLWTMRKKLFSEKGSRT